MTLLQQFQVFIGSIVIGMFFVFLWSIFNRIFYKLQGKVVRIPFETLLIIFLAYLYFRFLIAICDGILNLHYFLAIIIGITIYQRFYASHVNIALEKLGLRLQDKIFKPIRKYYGIIKTKLKSRFKKILKKIKGWKRSGKKKKKKTVD